MKSSLLSLRVIVILLGCAFFATACLPFVGDGSDDEATPTPDQIPTVIPVDSATPQAATSPVPTLQPLATRQPQATSAPPSCTPRNDWPIYTIQAGDTLYSIAQRTETTVDAIVAANCLGDANVIRTNQEIRVPRQPDSGDSATPEATATSQPGFLHGTPTPGGTAPSGSVEFTFIVSNNTATATGNTVTARTSGGDVELAISVTNVASFQILKADGSKLHEGQAVSGSTSAGGNYTFRKLDRIGTSQQLIITIRAQKPDGTTVESDPISIRWP